MASYSSYGNFVKKLKRSNEPESYSAFIKRELKDDKKSFADALRAAGEKAIRQSSPYGKRGETLAKLGLEDSGYGEYISELTKSRLKSESAAAEQSLADAQRAAREGYAEYIEKYAAEQEKLYGSVVEKITDAALTDYNAMLEFAKESGLSGEYAKRAVESAGKAVSAKLKQKVISAINDKRLSGKDSYDYAIALGLSPEIAAELSEYAKKMNEINLSGSYLDGLKKN